MANDLVIKLLLKTGAFSTDLRTAKGQIQNFQKGCDTASKSISSFGKGLGINIGSLAKFNVGLAAAAAAGKVLKDGIKQNANVMDEIARKTDTAKAAWTNFTNVIVNGGAMASFKDLRKEVREAYDAFDKWNVTNNAVNTVLTVSETKYNRLLEVARDVSLADVDRLEALNEAAAIMQKQINMQRALANLDKKRSKEALESELAKKGVTSYSQKRLHEFLQLDESGTFEFENYLNQNQPANKGVKKAWLKAGGQYALADALYNIFRDQDKGLKVIQDYIKNNMFDYGTELVDYNEQQMKTTIAKLRKRIESGADKEDSAAKAKRDQEREEAKKQLEEEKKLHQDILEQIQEEIQKEEELGKQYERNSVGWLKHLDNVTELNKKLEETKQKLEAIRRREEFEAMGPLPQVQSKLPEMKLQYKSNSGLAMPKENIETIDFKGGIEKASKFTGALQNSAMAVSLLSESMKKLREDEEENVTGWEKFVDVLSLSVNILNTLSTIIETINTLTELFGIVSKSTAEAKKEEVMGETELVVAKQASAVAEAETVAASTAAAAAQGVETASVNSLAAAFTELAAAQTMAANVAVSGVAGVALGTAQVAAMTTAIVGAGTTVGAFANGGIIPGNSFTGDRLTANVNSGEMILNRSQQANLFRQINNGNGGGNQVQFHISGTDLVGVLNNNNRKNKVIR